MLKVIPPPTDLLNMMITRGDARDREPSPPRHGRPDESGFTLVETLVALVLLASVLVGLEKTVRFTLQSGAYATQQDTALNLIAADVAQVRALSFSDLQAGLNPNVESLISDPDIVAGGPTGYRFKPTGAPIAASNTNASQPPLVPHITPVTNGITYDISTYPTAKTSAPGLVTVYVIATWRSPTGATSTASAETEVAAP